MTDSIVITRSFYDTMECGLARCVKAARPAWSGALIIRGNSESITCCSADSCSRGLHSVLTASQIRGIQYSVFRNTFVALHNLVSVTTKCYRSEQFLNKFWYQSFVSWKISCGFILPLFIRNSRPTEMH